MGEVSGCNLIPKSTTLCGGSPSSSSKKTSTYSQTTRGRSKFGLSSSSRVRLCHTPFPGPTRLADPNRVRGARPYTGTLYLIFFFKVELVPMGMAHIL